MTAVVTWSLCLLQACTTIVLKQNPDGVSIERRFGFTSITLGGHAEGMLAEASAWGVLFSPLGFTAGYTHQDLAALDASCRLVLWVRSPSDAEKVASLFRDGIDVCTISTSGEAK